MKVAKNGGTLMREETIILLLVSIDERVLPRPTGADYASRYIETRLTRTRAQPE